MLLSNPQGIGEIYMIHGSYERPNSLVLTADDYERFEERNAYLAAKLLTTFVEHPIIFLGYSLTDRNIRSILRSIARCLTQENVDTLRDRLLFVNWVSGSVPVVEPFAFLVDDYVINMHRITVPNFVEVFDALVDLSEPFLLNFSRRSRSTSIRSSFSTTPSLKCLFWISNTSTLRIWTSCLGSASGIKWGIPGTSDSTVGASSMT